MLDKTKYQIDLLILNQGAVANATSLLDQLSPEVTVFDAYKEQMNLTWLQKKKAQILLDACDRKCNYDSALLWVKNREYDCAFHVGEWWLTFFVAKHVKANKKYAWIHSDINRAEYFDADNYFLHDNEFEKYIFVSQNSMKACIEAYPFLKEKALCIYNINDVKTIRAKAEEEVTEDYFSQDLPVILTCANVRQEKNHDRQLTAMKLLKDRGVDFIWLNVGSTVEKVRCQALEQKAKLYGLQDRFILAGAAKNPYKYMKHATAVTVLSDYESWSMVITEAKILGKPIVATRTSGALEQIEHEKTGLLTDFTAESIADEIEKLLKNPTLIEKIQRNNSRFDNTPEILRDFDKMVDEKKAIQQNKKDSILLVIDDVNYAGGAHVAAKQLISTMEKNHIAMDIFSLSVPSAKLRNELPSTRFYSLRDIEEDRLFHRRLVDCLLDPSLPEEIKKHKWKMSRDGKRKQTWNTVFDQYVRPGISRFFSQYGTVILLSEGSELKKDVAECNAAQKIQWIHTDYSAWCHASDYAKARSCNDREYWKHFDKIVLLSEEIRKKMVALFPEYEEKFYVIPNFVNVEGIRKKANMFTKELPCVSFVTVCRFEKVKAIPRLLTVLQKLADEGYLFKWTFIGDGEEWAYCRDIVYNSSLKECVYLIGAKKNPFPIMKRADVFGLFSYYEGLPNTIYEAMAMGIPCCATNVGGVRDQIADGVNGWIADNDEEGIYEKLSYIMEHPEAVQKAKESLKSFQYDNDRVTQKVYSLLGINK